MTTTFSKRAVGLPFLSLALINRSLPAQTADAKRQKVAVPANKFLIFMIFSLIEKLYFLRAKTLNTAMRESTSITTSLVGCCVFAFS